MTAAAGVAREAELAAGEREILTNRLVMGVAASLLLGMTLDKPATMLLLFGAYLSLNSLMFWLWRVRALPRPLRLLAGIALDMGMGAVTMVIEPEAMAGVYPLYLWAILGNGFRFGLKWLVVAAVAAFASFAFVVTQVSLWQQHLPLTGSLLGALVVIPLYCSKLIRKLSKAREQAESASRAKSFFLASVSHELRTPLNAIIGYGTHLRGLDLRSDQRDMVDASVNAGEHLLFLIDQLLFVSAQESMETKARDSEFTLATLIGEARDIVALRAEEKQISIFLQADPQAERSMWGQADAIRTILINLASNAVKFTDAGSITIRGGVAQGGFWLEVEDTGSGVAEGMEDRIFEAFQQGGEAVAARYGGTGLGLAICARIAAALGGRVFLKESSPLGSCFRFEAPAQFVERDSEADGAPVRILALVSPGGTSLLPERGIVVRHVECTGRDEAAAVLKALEPGSADIVAIDPLLARDIPSEAEIWRHVADAGAVAVEMAAEHATLDDIRLRAEFATILPVHAGSIAVRNALRIASAFAPRARVGTSDAPLPVPKTGRASRRILVADDNRTNRSIFETILTSAGHSVVLAADGHEALDLLERDRFDIALLDVNMPRLTGIEACRLWRQMEGPRDHLPILAVTADVTDATGTACRDAGMDRRLTKPVAAPLLLDAIDAACAGAGGSPARGASDPLGVVVPLVADARDAGDQPIDHGHVDYLFSIGGASFVADLFASYRADVDENRAKLAAAVRAQDLEAFRFAAHAFKSASNNVGASAFAERCARLEKISEDAFARSGPAYLRDTEIELDRVLAALAAIPLTLSAAG